MKKNLISHLLVSSFSAALGLGVLILTPQAGGLQEASAGRTRVPCDTTAYAQAEDVVEEFAYEVELVRDAASLDDVTRAEVGAERAEFFDLEIANNFTPMFNRALCEIAMFDFVRGQYWPTMSEFSRLYQATQSSLEAWANRDYSTTGTEYRTMVNNYEIINAWMAGDLATVSEALAP